MHYFLHWTSALDVNQEVQNHSVWTYFLGILGFFNHIAIITSSCEFFGTLIRVVGEGTDTLINAQISGCVCFVAVGVAAQVALADFSRTLAVCSVLTTTAAISRESCTIRDPGNFHTPFKYAVWEPCLKNCTSNTYDLLSSAKCGSLRQLLFMVHCLQSTHGDKVLNRPIVLAM